MTETREMGKYSLTPEREEVFRAEKALLTARLEGLVHPSLRQVREQVLARRMPPYPQVYDPSMLRVGDLVFTVERIEKIPGKGHLVLSVHPDATFQKAGRVLACLTEPHLHALVGPARELTEEERQRFGELLREESPKQSEDRVREAEWLKQLGFVEDVRGLKGIGMLPENDGADNTQARWFYLLQSNLIQPSPLSI